MVTSTRRGDGDGPYKYRLRGIFMPVSRFVYGYFEKKSQVNAQQKEVFELQKRFQSLKSQEKNIGLWDLLLRLFGIQTNKAQIVEKAKQDARKTEKELRKSEKRLNGSRKDLEGYSRFLKLGVVTAVLLIVYEVNCNLITSGDFCLVNRVSF